MKRGLILALAFLALLPIVSAQVDCKIEAGCSAGLASIGYVSMQGHFSGDNAGLAYPYGLCCPSSWGTPGNGQTIFKYSIADTHVAEPSYASYSEEIKFPFSQPCQIVAGSCTGTETCLFKMSALDNAHVADCNTPNTPMANNFGLSLCCAATEICNNGADDDGDGFVDCTDSDCNEVGAPGGIPQICSGDNNQQSTSQCVLSYSKATQTTTYQAACLGQAPPGQYYYCSYGVIDDSTPPNVGVCCQTGYRSEYDPVMGTWSCVETDACGLLPAYGSCAYDFEDETNNWLSILYSGDPDDWCQSQTPNIMVPIPEETPNYYGSQACCLLPKHGEIGYYPDAHNVKIFG